ncbi:hypothetical protein HNR34_000643 [Geobacillus subterraneus]|nr:hypothetical protein IC803_10225 [Geobacillus sp. 46C-IIa]
MATIQFEIKKRIATLSSSPKGWNKELNLVSWNGYPPKYDIRDWDSSYTKMGRGVTLSEGEARNLYYALKQLFEENSPKNSSVQNGDWRKRIDEWTENSPLFIQQIKNVLMFMNEKGYLAEKQRQLLMGIQSTPSEEALQYEIESIRSIYPSFYRELGILIQELGEEELGQLFLYICDR